MAAAGTMHIRKIMLLGEIGVGKTSIAKRLVFDRYAGVYKATVGVDVYRYEVMPQPASGRLQFLVFDTDGNFGDAIFREAALREAHAAMVVGDMSRPRTLDSMVTLAAGFEDAFPGRFTAYVLNKRDLVPAGTAPPLPAPVAQRALPVYTTSALTGAQVREAFDDAAATILRRGL